MHISKKKYPYVGLLLWASIFLASCAGIQTIPINAPFGLIYTQVTVPGKGITVALDESAKPEKTGKAVCINYLGLISKGDCGIEAAMFAGNITKIHSVDTEYMHILGIIAKKVMVVKGE